MVNNVLKIRFCSFNDENCIDNLLRESGIFKEIIRRYILYRLGLVKTFNSPDGVGLIDLGDSFLFINGFGTISTNVLHKLIRNNINIKMVDADKVIANYKDISIELGLEELPSSTLSGGWVNDDVKLRIFFKLLDTLIDRIKDIGYYEVTNNVSRILIGNAVLLVSFPGRIELSHRDSDGTVFFLGLSDYGKTVGESIDKITESVKNVIDSGVLDLVDKIKSLMRDKGLDVSMDTTYGLLLTIETGERCPDCKRKISTTIPFYIGETVSVKVSIESSWRTIYVSSSISFNMYRLANIGSSFNSNRLIDIISDLADYMNTLRESKTQVYRELRRPEYPVICNLVSRIVTSIPSNYECPRRRRKENLTINDLLGFLDESIVIPITLKEIARTALSIP